MPTTTEVKRCLIHYLSKNKLYLELMGNGRIPGPSKLSRINMQIDISTLTIEELYEKIEIQLRIKDLESNDKDRLRSGITTLAGVSYYTKRKDALYPLIGYYIIETNNLTDKESFFQMIHSNCNYQLYKIILKDVAQYSNFFRKSHFVHLLVTSMPSYKMSEKEKNEIEEIIQNATWGKKLKLNFKDKLRQNEEF